MKLMEIFIVEAIKTATLDTAAHAVLMKDFPQVISDIIKKAEIELPPKQLRPDAIDQYDYNTSKHYDNLYQLFTKEKSRLIYPICMQAGVSLTRLTRKHLHNIKHQLENDLYWLRLLEEIIDNVRVKVEPREASKDYYRDYNGYYSETDNLLKIFVKQDDISDAALELIAEEVLGESERHGYNNLIKAIVPVFVHEYVHLEQRLKRRKPAKDFGHITVGIRGRARRGKRGGYHRSPNESLSAYLRYKGNVKEVDAFASESVAEMMHEFHRLNGWKDINDKIRDIRQNLSFNYADSRNYQHYQELLQNTFDNAYADIGLDPRQMQQVWRRFAKRVYQKLEDYIIPTVGRARETQLEQINPQWLELVKTTPMSRAFVEIARDQAKQILDNTYDLDRTINNIRQGWGGTEKAENFLRLYYFGDLWPDTPATEKLIDTYRSLVIKLIST